MNPWFWHCSRLQGFGSTAGSAAFLLWNNQENTCVYFSQIHNFKGKEAPYFLNLAYISPVKHCFEKENSDHGKGWSVWWWISLSIKTNELNSLLAGKNCRCIPEKQYREYHKNPHRNSRRESWVNAAGGWHTLGDKLTVKKETRQYHNTKKILIPKSRTKTKCRRDKSVCTTTAAFLWRTWEKITQRQTQKNIMNTQKQKIENQNRKEE